MMPEDDTAKGTDFIRRIVREHNASGRFGGKVHTRFPPEPNGYLHIGHAQGALTSFSVAREFGGKFNLRLDDTNPSKEEREYVDSIRRDLRWLGIDWEDREFYASDYFERLYQLAVALVKKGGAYVDSLGADEIRRLRGTAVIRKKSAHGQGDGRIETRPGEESPYRDRSVEENVDLFTRMRAGEFEDGAHVLRAKIDMTHPNLNMRDPVMYRIMRATHHRTGDDWCIYPMYDWAHGQSDAIEGVTHSICSLEFENHRPLYDWFLDRLVDECGELGHHPQQIEYARLNVSYTILSKRRLIELVDGGHVTGWDDPRMPTLSGLRRRGYTPEAIRGFIKRIGISKADSCRDVALLEGACREHLNKTAERRMCVLRPLKVVIENYPEGQVEEMELVNNPEDASAGTRKVPFSRELWIERDDFMEDPPRKFHRLSPPRGGSPSRGGEPGREVRLRSAYFVTCTGLEKDDAGNVTELRCTYDPATRGGDSPDGRKVRGTLHWVSAAHAIDCEVRLYGHLFTKEDPDDVGGPGEGGDPREGGEGGKRKTWLDNLDPRSLEVLEGCKAGPSLAGAEAGSRFQFERQGYFCVDPDSTAARPVFNRTVALRDTWAKIRKKAEG